MPYDVGGCHGILGEFVGSQIARQTMEVHAQQTSVQSWISLRQQARQQSGEHIAAARFGHAGISRTVEKCPSIRRGYQGMGTFEHDIDLELFCFLQCQVQPLQQQPR